MGRSTMIQGMNSSDKIAEILDEYEATRADWEGLLYDIDTHARELARYKSPEMAAARASQDDDDIRAAVDPADWKDQSDQVAEYARRLYRLIGMVASLWRVWQSSTGTVQGGHMASLLMVWRGITGELASIIPLDDLPAQDSKTMAAIQEYATGYDDEPD